MVLLIGSPQSSQAVWEVLSKRKLGMSQVTVIWTWDIDLHGSLFPFTPSSKFAKMHQKQELVIHHISKHWFPQLEFSQKYSAASPVFKALFGIWKRYEI